MAKFNIKKIKKNDWLLGIAVVLIFVYIQSGTSTLESTICPDDEVGCLIKENLRPVWDWLKEPPRLLYSLIGVIAFAFISYTFKEKRQ